jgi:hypothetical protein
MNSDAEQLLVTPDYHFLAFDGDMALFLPLDRGSYHRSAFLDRRAQATSDTPLRLPLEPLIAAAKKHSPPQTGWIFHVAHCGSTLLSRLIDSPQSSLVLREPPPLRQLGLAAATGDSGSHWRGRLALAHSMAARRFDPLRLTIVKANVPVNFMLDELSALDPSAPSILLYRSLDAYLLAVLRSDQHRAWVGRISDQLAPALGESAGLIPGAPLAHRAAALWLAQMLAFQSVLGGNPQARSLDAKQLFAAPAEIARAVAEHLGVTDADLEANAAALANRYAKDPLKPFDRDAHRQREDEDRRRLAEEIAVAGRWIERSVAAASLRPQFDRPLLGMAPNLLG